MPINSENKFRRYIPMSDYKIQMGVKINQHDGYIMGRNKFLTNNVVKDIHLVNSTLLKEFKTSLDGHG